MDKVVCLTAFVLLAVLCSMDALGVEDKPSLPPLTLGGGEPGEPLPFKNVNVLRHLNETQFLRVMGFVVESLGVRCTFCHNPENYSLDEKEQKAREREMIRMVRFINPTFFNAERVTCFTCHGGKTAPPYLPDGIDTIPSLVYSAKLTRLPLSYSSVQKLTHLAEPQVLQVMAFFVSATGAESCVACHNPADFASDELPRKRRAREMIGMVQAVTPTFFREERLTCYTCHQGRRQPGDLPEDWLPGWK
jgi:hypothetical protein